MRISAFSLAIVLVISSGYWPAARGATIYGVAVEGAAQRLVTWDSAAPGVILSDVPITGLPSGETIRGIDFDPAFFPGNQRLFAIGAGSDQFANVYRLNFLTGFASKLPPSSSPRADAQGQFYGVTSFGSDALNSVSDAGVLAGYSTTFNSGAGGAVLEYSQGDTNAGQSPRVVHLNSSLAIDTALDVLVRIFGGSNPRQLATIGPLGANFDDAGAIDGATGNSSDTIFAALLPASQTQSNFYTLNQFTGAVTLVGQIGSGLLITAMAVEPPLRPVPEPNSLTLLVGSILTSLALMRRQCRQ